MIGRRSAAHVVGALLALSAHSPAWAEEGTPILRAHSRTVDVRDGDRLLRGVWNADPASALDVYDARRTRGGKRVTFISDIDSLSFEVRPGDRRDFTILLDDRDSCRTRVSAMAGAERVGSDSTTDPVTVPIAIRHGKLHLGGTINGSETLDLIFDTGADMNVLYPSALRRGARIRFDGTASNSGTGGTTVRQTSRDNRLEVAGLRWERETILYVEKQADRADGIIGYPAFEDRIVEIDYDRMVLRVHDTLPPHAGFARTALLPVGSLTAVAADLAGGWNQASGPFILDTGGTGTVMVNQAFATAHGLRGALRRLGTSRSRGVGSGVVRNEVLLLPELSVAGLVLHGVPVHVELPDPGNAAPPGGALCMDVLRRFNTLLDYPAGQAYFKPSATFATPFRPGIFARPWPAIALGAICLAALAALARSVRRRARPLAGR